MDRKTPQLLFMLLRSAIADIEMCEEQKALFSPDMLPELKIIASKHDVFHLIVYALKKNSLLEGENNGIENEIINAVFRYESINYDLDKLCRLLETGGIPFIPLKGSVLREYYVQPWMRTSCDIDILVKYDDLDRAIDHLTEKGGYTPGSRTAHDISTFSPNKTHVEVHFNLLEEGTAQQSNEILESVWENVNLREGYKYLYDMTDEFFYLYHIAHMARHFEVGGCGIRTFIDLWVLDNIPNADKNKRDEILSRAGLLKFANSARELSQMWFECKESKEPSELLIKLEAFVLSGGAYGTISNRVALNQRKRGGKIGYIFSRIFVPYERLVCYYPILKNKRWLTPIMQVRRWFMLLNPGISKMAKKELEMNMSVNSNKAREMNRFLQDVGLSDEMPDDTISR